MGSRVPGPKNSIACATWLASVPRSCAPRTKSALEFRDLLINASYRSAQPVLDTVDAVIRDLGFGAMKLPELPPPHVAHHLGRPGLVELWKPFTLGDDEDGDEVEEGWLDADAPAICRPIAEQVRAWIDEAPVLEFDRAA